MRLSGRPDLVPPDAGRLVVVEVHGGPQPVLGEAEPAIPLRRGEQFPGERDGLLLEVVAEREVPQHLEERAVPGGLADFLDVRGAHALLRAGGPVERRRRLAQEVRLERLHARVHQQQRGVVGDQRRGRDNRVPALGEVGKETAGDLCRLHQWPSSTWSVRLSRAGRAGCELALAVDFHALAHVPGEPGKFPGPHGRADRAGGRGGPPVGGDAQGRAEGEPEQPADHRRPPVGGPLCSARRASAPAARAEPVAALSWAA